MTKTARNFALSAAVAATLYGCGGSDSTSEVVGSSSGTIPDSAKHLVFTVDGDGYVTLFADDGANTITKVKEEQPLNNLATPTQMSLGEIHFTADGKRALVVVSQGMTASDGTPTGGGILIYDATTGTLVDRIALPSATGKLPRLVHCYMDPDGQHIWLNNDGPSGDTDNDSVFRVNIDSSDATDSDGSGKADDMYKDFLEIIVGNGHKKSAFSFPTAAHADARKLFVTHNLSEHSASVIDNDPSSPTFLTVIDTVDLGAGNLPHGMTFSEVSGHVYTGILGGGTIAANIIDATSPATPVANTSISAGSAAGQIPAGGYVKAVHSEHAEDNGRWVLMTGYQKKPAPATVGGNGYLSVIDATTDTVTAVVDLGDLGSSSFNVVEKHTDTGHRIVAYIGSTGGSHDAAAPVNPDAIVDQVAVVEIDGETGMPVDGTTVQYVEVGEGSAHRNGKTTDDGAHVYMPNGGGCTHAASLAKHTVAGTSCNTISVIDAATNTVIATLETKGHEPSSIGIIKR